MIKKESTGSAEKVFFKMGEVCKLTGLEPHVLRFWESEFSQLRPQKNRAGHRVFKKDDVQLIQKIKKYLHEQGFTIAGAQKRLQEEGASGSTESWDRKQRVYEELSEIKTHIQNALNILDHDKVS